MNLLKKKLQGLPLVNLLKKQGLPLVNLLKNDKGLPLVNLLKKLLKTTRLTPCEFIEKLQGLIPPC